MVQTRSQSRALFQRQLTIFPDELWLEIFSHLPAKDLGQVVCLDSKFFGLREDAWQYACAKRWPAWYQIARAPDTQWRRQYELLELRERELTSLLKAPAILQMQNVVNARHRTVLTEWLAEVSMKSFGDAHHFHAQCEDTANRSIAAGGVGLEFGVNHGFQGSQLLGSLPRLAPNRHSTKVNLKSNVFGDIASTLDLYRIKSCGNQSFAFQNAPLGKSGHIGRKCSTGI